jgi:hypothetical protein
VIGPEIALDVVGCMTKLVLAWVVEARPTSTIWLYTNGRLSTSQAVRIENRLGCPMLFGPPVMY